MEIAINEDKKKRMVITRKREELVKVLEKQEKPVKLEGFTTEELDEILFDYEEEERIKKRFALPPEVLRKIDMSNVSFDNFCAYHVNFSGMTGVRIDPNKLYKKSCWGTVFEGVTFLNKFTAGHIEECNFTGSHNAVIGGNSIIGNDITLGVRNVFKDVTFGSPIMKGNIVGSDFTGSKGAVIELGSDWVDDIGECRLKDTTLQGSFANCLIYGAEFSGAKAADGGKVKIDPNKIATTKIYGSEFKNLQGCNFEGVEFTAAFAPYNNFMIKKANFEGSEGAVLYPDAVFEKDYSFTKLTDVKFADGSLITKSQLEGTNFTGSEGAVISGPQKSIALANLKDVAIEFDDPKEILSTPGIESAGYGDKPWAFSDIFREKIAVEFDEPVKVFMKKINDSVNNANK